MVDREDIRRYRGKKAVYLALGKVLPIEALHYEKQD